MEFDFVSVQLERDRWVKREELRAQWVKKKWLLDGDHNSTYFHEAIAQHRSKCV